MNKLEKGEGIIIFPISMPKIKKEQSPEKILEFLIELRKHRSKGIFSDYEPIKVLILYTSDLYSKYGLTPKEKSLNECYEHKARLLKGIEKLKKIQFDSSFFYFNNLLDIHSFFNKNEYENKFFSLKYYIKKNKSLEELQKKFIRNLNKDDNNENNQNFLLDEILALHLIFNNLNKILQKDNSKWILMGYPSNRKNQDFFIEIIKKDIFEFKNKKKIYYSNQSFPIQIEKYLESTHL